MKCEKCGNTATYHYVSRVNGKKTEMHLCSECASKLEEKENVFAGAERMMNRMMKAPLFGAFDSFFADPFRLPSFGSFFADPFAEWERFLPGEAAEPETREEKKQENAGTDPELSRQREINMLREQMKKAVEKEEFEKAAELRDKLRAMEK